MTIAELREAIAIASDPGVKAGEWACAQSTLDLAMPGLVDLAEAVRVFVEAQRNLARGDLAGDKFDDMVTALDKVVKS